MEQGLKNCPSGDFCFKALISNEVSFTYDDLGRAKTVTYDDNTTVTYVYNGEGAVYSITEQQGNNTTLYLYTYDSIGRLVGCEKKVNGTTTLRTWQEFNEHNQQTNCVFAICS